MKLLLVLLACLLSHGVLAVQPTSGAWFDPTESGRGTTIEVRNGILVNTFFGYNDEGEPTWWQGVATEQPEGSGVYIGDYNYFDGGQCNTCDYQSPEVSAEDSIGQFTLTFHTDETMTMEWAGGTNEYVKLNWAFGSPLDFAYGAFFMQSYGTFGSVQGSMNYIATEERETSSGERYLLGRPHGSFIDEDDAYIITNEGVDEDGNPLLAILNTDVFSDQLWIVSYTSDRIKGKMWAYESGGSPVGAGFDAVGARLFDQVEMLKGMGDFLGEGFNSNTNKSSNALTKEQFSYLREKANQMINSHDSSVEVPSHVLKIADKLRLIKDELTAK